MHISIRQNQYKYYTPKNLKNNHQLHYDNQIFFKSNQNNHYKSRPNYPSKLKSLVKSVMENYHNPENQHTQQYLQKQQRHTTQQNQTNQNQQGKHRIKTENVKLQKISTSLNKISLKEMKNFNRTKSKIFDMNFNHHNSENCVCQDCDCGRHLCKLHIVKPDMIANTTYKKQFYPKIAVNNIVARPKSGKKIIEGPHLDMNTSYRKSYLGKQEQIQKPRPLDCLEFKGPTQNLTSYKMQFPGHRGQNQYIKYEDNVHRNGILAFNGNSRYRESFGDTRGKKSQKATWKNYFKFNKRWFADSTYKMAYEKKQNPQNFVNNFKIIEKLEINPDYQHQYETTYQNDFLSPKSKICPAKLKISTQKSKNFKNLKDKFIQNSDFKSMSPNFQAISTQGYSFI